MVKRKFVSSNACWRCGTIEVPSTGLETDDESVINIIVNHADFRSLVREVFTKERIGNELAIQQAVNDLKKEMAAEMDFEQKADAMLKELDGNKQGGVVPPLSVPDISEEEKALAENEEQKKKRDEAAAAQLEEYKKQRDEKTKAVKEKIAKNAEKRAKKSGNKNSSKK